MNDGKSSKVVCLVLAAQQLLGTSDSGTDQTKVRTHVGSVESRGCDLVFDAFFLFVRRDAFVGTAPMFFGAGYHRRRSLWSVTTVSGEVSETERSREPFCLYRVFSSLRLLRSCFPAESRVFLISCDSKSATSDNSFTRLDVRRQTASCGICSVSQTKTRGPEQNFTDEALVFSGDLDGLSALSRLFGILQRFGVHAEHGVRLLLVLHRSSGFTIPQPELQIG